MSDSPNRAVSRRSFLTTTGAAGALALAGCTEGPSDGGGNEATEDGLSGEISITGSSTVYPVVQAVTERFRQEYPDVEFSLSRTGSGGGFSNQFCPGNSDFNNASRPITSEEEDLCAENGVEYHEVNIATDALTVIVNNDNDWVDCMTVEELAQAWRADGASNWSDINDDWPDEAINRFGAADTSGTFDYFNENVVGEDTEHTTEYQPTEEDETIVQGIRDNEGGIGYFGFAYYNSNSEAVKAVDVKVEDGDECSSPSLANAKDGSYPLARPLFLYVAESALQKEEVYEFIRFYLEQAETDVVQDIGYVPSSPAQRDENLEKLDEIAG